MIFNMKNYDYNSDDHKYGYHSWPKLYHDELLLLIDRLNEYDALRMKLMKKGGAFSEMEELANLLRMEIPIKADHLPECSLMNQKSLRRVLSYYEDGALTLDIRQHEYGLPLYYLCKVQDDYHCTYNSVLQDL
jgi:hypothetical protein